MHENVSKQVVDSISLLEGMAHCSKRSVPSCHTQMKSIIHSKIRQLLLSVSICILILKLSIDLRPGARMLVYLRLAFSAGDPDPLLTNEPEDCKRSCEVKRKR